MIVVPTQQRRNGHVASCNVDTVRRQSATSLCVQQPSALNTHPYDKSGPRQMPDQLPTRTACRHRALRCRCQDVVSPMTENKHSLRWLV